VAATLPFNAAPSNVEVARQAFRRAIVARFVDGSHRSCGRRRYEQATPLRRLLSVSPSIRRICPTLCVSLSARSLLAGGLIYVRPLLRNDGRLQVHLTRRCYTATMYPEFSPHSYQISSIYFNTRQRSRNNIVVSTKREVGAMALERWLSNLSHLVQSLLRGYQTQQTVEFSKRNLSLHKCLQSIGVTRVHNLGAYMASAEREHITGVWGQNPQRGPAADP